MANKLLSADSCVDACLRCAKICWQAATNHCLTQGGKHAEAEHLRLLLNCATMCRTAAEFQLSHSRFSNRTAALCAEICEACALSCEGLGDMDECVTACRICAASCEEIANSE